MLQNDNINIQNIFSVNSFHFSKLKKRKEKKRILKKGEDIHCPKDHQDYATKFEH